MIRLEIKNYNLILTRKIDKYEYLTGEEILPSDQRRAIEQAVYIFSFL